MTNVISIDPRDYQPHSFLVRVNWEDTDAAGIVYYANYLKYFERARSDLARCIGIDQFQIMKNEAIIFPVRRCELDYLAPARLEDELNVATLVCRVGGASINMQQNIIRDGRILVGARIRLGCANLEGRPHRMPNPVRNAFSEVNYYSTGDRH